MEVVLWQGIQVTCSCWEWPVTLHKESNFANKNECGSGFFCNASRQEFSLANTLISALSRGPHHTMPAFWPTGLRANIWVLFWATAFVVTCYAAIKIYTPGIQGRNVGRPLEGTRLGIRKCSGTWHLLSLISASLCISALSSFSVDWLLCSLSVGRNVGP